MASVASHLIQEVTVRAQSDSLEDAREICADGTYFPNNLRISNNTRYMFVSLLPAHTANDFVQNGNSLPLTYINNVFYIYI